MKLRKAIFALVIATITFFSGTVATRLCVLNEIHSLPPDVRWWYTSFAEQKENQMPFLTAYKKGKAEAQTDAKEGKLKLKISGWGADTEVEEKNFANIYQKYEIEMNRIAGCLISAKIIGYGLGYNGIMTSQIEQRYGVGFLEKMDSESN